MGHYKQSIDGWRKRFGERSTDEVSYPCHKFPIVPFYNRCVELLPRCAVALAALFDGPKGRNVRDIDVGLTLITVSVN